MAHKKSSPKSSPSHKTPAEISRPATTPSDQFPVGPSRWGTPDWISCIVLLSLVGVVYPSALTNGFVNFDDQLYVSQNPAVQQGLTLKSLRYAWTTFDVGNWIPLTWMSYELDTTLFGIAPAGYIFTNLVLHATNCILLYVFLRRSTSQIAASFVTALLFAVHPQHVESVAWIAERKDVLSTCFLLLTLLAWLHYVKQPRSLTYLIVTVLFLSGLCAKSMLVTLPLLLLLLDSWPLNRLRNDAGQRSLQLLAKQVAEKIPLLIISFIFGIITIQAQRDAGAVANTETLLWTERVALAIRGMTSTLQNTFIPTQLSVFYPVHREDLTTTSLLWPSLILLMTTITVVGLRRRMPYLMMGWLWFVIAFLPVSGILQVGSQAYADRYSYVPHIGLFIAIVFSLFAIPEEWKFAPILKWGFTLVTAVFLSFLTSLQVGYWQNPISLWTHALNVDRDNWMANYMLGDYLRYEQHPNEALAYLQKAQQLQPGSPLIHESLADIYTALGDSQQATAHSITTVKLRPSDRSQRIRLAGLLIDARRYEEANALLEEGLKYTPHDDVFEFGLGNIAKETGQFATAIRYFDAVSHHRPDNPKPLALKAECLVKLQRVPEAIEILEIITQRSPDNLDYRLELAKLYARQQQTAAAVQVLKEILSVDPNRSEAQGLLKTLQKTVPNDTGPPD